MSTIVVIYGRISSKIYSFGFLLALNLLDRWGRRRIWHLSPIGAHDTHTNTILKNTSIVNPFKIFHQIYLPTARSTTIVNHRINTYTSPGTNFYIYNHPHKSFARVVTFTKVTNVLCKFRLYSL